MQGSCPEGALIGKHLTPSASIIKIVKGDVFLSCSTRFGVIPDYLRGMFGSIQFRSVSVKYEVSTSVFAMATAYHAVCEIAHRKYQIDY